MKKTARHLLTGIHTRALQQCQKNTVVLLLLLLLAEASALGVVYNTYRSRALFAELENLRSGAEEMRIAWSQLLLEQSTLASFNRVVEVAQQQLGMKVPDAASVIVLQQP